MASTSRKGSLVLMGTGPGIQGAVVPGMSATLPRMGRLEEPPPGTPRYDTLPRSRSLPRPAKAGSQPGTMSLSMREKARMKQRINKEHNSNFRAGHVEVHEDQLIRTGIRGRKRYILYCVIVLLGLLTLANLLVTATIFLVLNFHGWKPAGLELVPPGLTRFLQDTNLGHFILPGGNVSGPGEKVTLEGTSKQYFCSKAMIKLTVDKEQEFDELTRDATSVTIDSSSLSFAVQDSVYFLKPGSQTPYSRLGADIATYRLSAAEHLNSSMVVTNKLKTMSVESQQHVTLRGVEGAKFRARKVDVYADKEIVLESAESIRIAARKGVILSKVSDIPLIDVAKADSPSARLCVCLSSGLLFAVEGNTLCSDIVQETEGLC